MIDERKLKSAIKNGRSFYEAARHLGVSYNTFKKYAKLYDVFIQGGKNPSGKGIPKMYNGHRRELKDVLAGQYNGKRLNPTRLKRWLINEMVFAEECSICGYNKRRITDGTMALMIAYNDGDRTNYNKENLSLICYNCTYETCGNLMGRTKEYIYDVHTGNIIDEVNFK